jgi:hypothetical protein
MRLVAAVAAVALLPGVSPALAQPSVTPPVPAPYQYQPAPWQQPGPTETHRYGSTIALVDGLSFGAMLVGAIMFASGINSGEDNEDDAATGALLMIGGMAGYALGGPIVHGTKGNRSGAWTSFALRLGLPMVGAAIGESMHDTRCQGDYCYEEDNGEGASLAGVGIVTAMVVDWFVLAKVQRPTHAYVPYATTGRDGDVTVGLAGSF